MPLRSADALLFACLLAGLETPCAGAKEVDFNRDVRPILNAHCMACHGGVKHAGGISVQFREDILGKGKSGEICVVPGKPEASELIRRLTTDDEDDRMPKEKPALSPEQVDILTRWVAQGAKWGDHWSFVAPVASPAPAVRKANWPRNDIDRFILARLESEGLAHSPEADRATLLRRVTLDLTGLPPTSEETAAFVADNTPGAYERAVDRLMASPRFGERWAAMWMDLARYGDSKSLGHDGTRDIWPYRDWIIAAFNADMRWDDFIVRQMAGDMLPAGQTDLIATGFHRLTKNNDEGGTIDEEYRIYAVIDRVNTTWAAFMGIQMGCVQCHGHPYDPLRDKDYYGSYAFLNQSEDSDKDDDRPTMKVAHQPSEAERLRQLIADAERQAKQDDAGAKGITWKSLKPSLATSSGKGARLTVDGSGKVQAGGERPAVTVSDLTLPLAGNRELTAVALLTGVAKGAASGRHPDGNFVVSAVEFSRVKTGAAAPNARFLRIDIPGSGKCVNVSEIELLDAQGVNLATKAKATQSSTFPGYPADIAIDGKRSSGIDNTTSTHTESNPWLQLDLGNARRLSTIRIWNRMDEGNDARILGAVVSLRDEAGKTVWSRRIALRPSSPLIELQVDRPELAVDIAKASADFEQASYPAASVITNAMPATTGWAVAPKTREPHRLTLSLAEKLILAPDEQLRVRIHHAHTKPGYEGMDLAGFSLEATDSAAALDRNRTTEERLAALRKQLAQLPAANFPFMRELPKDKRRATHLLVRGGWNTPGEKIAEPFTPATLPPMAKDLPRDRLGFARWIASPENPLTARVAVNHFWRELFGNGLVATAEDFGTMGEHPSHPELLDTLAHRFVHEMQWSPKRLIREMVLSSAYRQSSATNAKLTERDPANRLLARGPRKRLTGEMVRDQALALAGILNTEESAGPPYVPPSPGGYLRNAFTGASEVKVDTGPGRLRRSVYAYWKRLEPFATLTIFDASDRDACSARRFTTNSPLQALTALNEEILVEAQKAAAKRLAATGGKDTDRIRAGLALVGELDPDPAVTTALGKLLTQARERYRADPKLAAAAKLTEEEAAWWQVATVILNTDTALNRN